MRRAWMGLLAASLASVAGAEALPVANPGFEAAPKGESLKAPDWPDISGTQGGVVDETVVHSGKRALRLEFRPPFSGVLQSLDASAWQGKRLVLRAMLRSRDLGQGASGLWLRADAAQGEPLAFKNSYQDPLDGTRDWELREVELVVPASATRLVFGAMTQAQGLLWVDDIELTAHTPVQPPSKAESLAYLDRALDLIQQHAYHADRVDWPAAKRSAREKVEALPTAEQTHAVIRDVLESLGDNHSHLLAPDTMARIGRGLGKNEVPDLRAAAVGRQGYVRVPAFKGTNTARADHFANALHDGLSSLARQGACGWIIDLRDNTGGNMYPMIRGLSGLLGDGTLGYFVDRDGRERWHIGLTGAPGDARQRHLPGGLDAPVAVLIGPATASSGEATLLSFVGRANTRTFGEPTHGLSTANQAYPLPDGANLAITTALMADRTGKVYGGQVTPDEIVVSPSHAAASDDAVTGAAARWLDSRPSCAGP